MPNVEAEDHGIIYLPLYCKRDRKLANYVCDTVYPINVVTPKVEAASTFLQKHKRNHKEYDVIDKGIYVDVPANLWHNSAIESNKSGRVVLESERLVLVMHQSLVEPNWKNYFLPQRKLVHMVL